MELLIINKKTINKMLVLLENKINKTRRDDIKNMLKLKDLKINDTFYLVNTCMAVDADDGIMKFKVIKDCHKNKKYIEAKALAYVYSNGKMINQRIEFTSKIYKNVESKLFSINDLSNAMLIMDDYDYYSNIGLQHNALDYDLDTYEFGKSIEQANKDLCKNGECTKCYCYNDKCPCWNKKDYYGQSKSEYDENREFINSLDPNDPADEWFFED